MKSLKIGLSGGGSRVVKTVNFSEEIRFYDKINTTDLFATTTTTRRRRRAWIITPVSMLTDSCTPGTQPPLGMNIFQPFASEEILINNFTPPQSFLDHTKGYHIRYAICRDEAKYQYYSKW